MSRYLRAGGSAAPNLAKRRLLTSADHTTTTTTFRFSPLQSHTYTSRAPFPIITKVEHPINSPLIWEPPQAPVSLEEIQAIHLAVLQTGALSPPSLRPIGPKLPSKRTKPSLTNVKRTFLDTPGLQPLDWHARNIPWLRAIEVTARLQQKRLFMPPLPPPTSSSSSSGSKETKEPPVAVDADAEMRKLAEQWATPKPARAKKHVKGGRQFFYLDDMNAARAALREALRAHELLKSCKQRELDADVADGVKSKRRPMMSRKPGPSGKLRRVESSSPEDRALGLAALTRELKQLGRGGGRLANDPRIMKLAEAAAARSRGGEGAGLGAKRLEVLRERRQEILDGPQGGGGWRSPGVGKPTATRDASSPGQDSGATAAAMRDALLADLGITMQERLKELESAERSSPTGEADARHRYLGAKLAHGAAKRRAQQEAYTKRYQPMIGVRDKKTGIALGLLTSGKDSGAPAAVRMEALAESGLRLLDRLQEPQRAYSASSTGEADARRKHLEAKLASNAEQQRVKRDAQQEMGGDQERGQLMTDVGQMDK